MMQKMDFLIDVIYSYRAFTENRSGFILSYEDQIDLTLQGRYVFGYK